MYIFFILRLNWNKDKTVCNIEDSDAINTEIIKIRKYQNRA